MNALGIYFGPLLVSIVETKGNKTINYIKVSLAAVSAGETLEEKVPGPVKITALLKDELVKNNVDTNEAIVSISGKDLIVRTFEMPILPRQELDTAVNFEVKKYIPFKIEELVSDFQYKIDKSIRKTRVLFVGIKKEALDNYLLILNQLGIKIRSIEYSAFSILRLLKLSNVKDKGIVGVVNIDFTKEDEANFVVLEDSFPLFSRDISFMGGYEETNNGEENQQNVILEKLKREIQISLDYYDRKFPGKNISKLFFITNPNFRADLDSFTKELGLAITYIDVNKYIDKPIPFSLPFAKAYSSSLFKIDTAVKINLLLAKERTTKKPAQEISTPLSKVMRLNTDIVTAVVCAFVFIIIFLSGTLRTSPLQKELSSIVGTRPTVPNVSAALSYKELTDLSSNYKKKTDALVNVVKNRLYVTPLLDTLPRVVPKGITLAKLSFKKGEDRTDLILDGNAYLGDTEKEAALVNNFLSNLKKDGALNKYFKEAAIVSLEQKEVDKVNMTRFTISCQDYKKGSLTK